MQEEKMVALVSRFQQTEDRLVLASLPVVVVALILSAMVPIFTDIALYLNLAITLLVLLVTIVVLIQHSAYCWINLSSATDQSDDISGAVFVLVTSAVMLLLLFVTIADAGSASWWRWILMLSLLISLIVQYRVIIVRYLHREDA